jgi:hypothetical protein
MDVRSPENGRTKIPEGTGISKCMLKGRLRPLPGKRPAVRPAEPLTAEATAHEDVGHLFRRREHMRPIHLVGAAQACRE